MDKSNIKKIAVFTSGGDAPGMNAAIRAVVRTAKYNELECYGIYRGYDGMIKGEIELLNSSKVANIIHRGGTILKSARSMDFMRPEGRKKAYDMLRSKGIDGCICIGGNGTYTGAMKFSEEFDFPMIGIPGTIDNDIYGTDYTIGFDTAINTAIEAIDKIRDTADSHNRLFFIEVMGRHSGFIALHTGIGSGAANVFLPEEDNSIESLVEFLQQSARKNKLFNLVVVAEGNKNGNSIEISDIIQERLPKYEVRVAIIGHLQRGGSPTCNDRVLASRLGHSAVELLMEGKKGIALGIVNGLVTETPFKQAISGDKKLNDELLRMAEVLAM